MRWLYFDKKNRLRPEYQKLLCTEWHLTGNEVVGVYMCKMYFFRDDKPVSPAVTVKACFKTTTGVSTGTTGISGTGGSSGTTGGAGSTGSGGASATTVTTPKVCTVEEGMDNPSVSGDICYGVIC